MKPTQTLLAAAVLSAGLLSATGANAALVSHLGGTLYDTDLKITWLSNGGGVGYSSWSEASAWAASLSVGGLRGWRLPTTLQPDATCRSQIGGSKGYDCTGSEMGHLFYNELGGKASQAITTTHNTNFSLFQNLQDYYYWSRTEDASDSSKVWEFNFSGGSQSVINKGSYVLALAVHDGDITAAPVPAAAWLLGSGLLGLIGVARRKAA